MDTVKKIQLICPKCKHEFQCNVGALEEQKVNLSNRLTEIYKWIAQYKYLPEDVKKQSKNIKERKGKIIQLEEIKKELSAVNAKLRIVRKEIEIQEFKIFRNIVKEFYGEKEFQKCIDEMHEREKAYQIKDTMGIDYYSSASGKHINKI